MTKNTLSKRITSIRNAVRVKSPGVEIERTKITKKLSEILFQEGLIEEFLETSSSSKAKKHIPLLFLRLKYHGTRGTSVITDLQCVSRPSLRVYAGCTKIPKIFGGLGLVILSTSRGLITDRQAKRDGLGGEILYAIWLFF